MVIGILIKNKKGISPLIATVLLISFAVSLGAVVMNWGSKIQISEQNVTAQCGNAYIDFFVLPSGKPDICIDGNQILMTVEAMSGKIKDLKIVLNGEKDVISKEKLLEKPIKEGSSARITINYQKQKYGNLKAIKIYPIIGNSEKLKTCVENFITMANLSICK